MVNRDSGSAQSSYTDGTFVKVTGTFNDSRGKIMGGDYIHVNWPSSGDTFINSFAGGKDLTINGTVVGHYTVDQTGATLTFNDQINNMQNVSGSFSFDVEARNTSEQDNTITISSGSTAAYIRMKGITKGSDDKPTGQGWRGCKVGMLTRSGGLAWGVYLNSNAAALDGDITLSDTLPGGQQFDAASPYDYLVIDGKNLSYDQFRSTYPKSSLEINGNTINACFNKDEFSGHTIMLNYGAKITDNDLAVFNNTANVTYQLKDATAASTSYSQSVKNVSFDANVNGTLPGELKVITKYTDEDNQIKILPNTVLVIITPDGNKIEKTTDTNGVVDIKDLPSGTYEIHEKSVPSYVKPREDTWKVVINDEKGQPLIIYHDVETSIPWSDLTPAKKTIPWSDLTPAKKTIPWTPLTPAKKTIPWSDLTPAKKTIPWTPLTPTKKTIPWSDLTPAKKAIPWSDLTPAKKTIPWSDLTPAKKTIPWSDLTPAKKTIPWSDLTPAKEVKPWSPLTPAKEVKPWVPLTPAKKTIPWTPLTPAEHKENVPASHIVPAAAQTITPAANNQNSKADNTNSSKQVTPAKLPATVASAAAKLLPQTGNQASTSLIALGSILCAGALGLVLVYKKKRN